MFHQPVGRNSARSLGQNLLAFLVVWTSWQGRPLYAQDGAVGPDGPPLVHKITAPSERLEMTVNTSRILTLDQEIPFAVVNNKDIVELTPLGPNEIQVFAKKPGVTQVNLRNKQNKFHTIDVMVFGDSRELQMLIKTEFPHSSIRVIALSQSVVLSGFVDRQDHVSQIIRIAEDYYPKVISHITVGGVQQISLHVKVMEVSRTKLRTLGVDWSTRNGADFFVSSVSGLIDAAAASTGTATGVGGDTIRFGVIGDNTSFFGFIEALRRNDLMKVLAEPTLVTVSGRPAFFNSGGEFPIIIPQSLGTVSIEYKKFGTQVDFVPIVLGNGSIRLEVRPRVSEIDNTRSVNINGTTVPGLRVREVDTGVEMKPGQTLALAGLVQQRVESENSGIPWVSDLPYFGVPFRKVRELINEVELLVIVTPQVIEAVDCSELSPCGPGMSSDIPGDWDLYMRGTLEVPARGPCGPGDCQNGNCDTPAGPYRPNGAFGPQGEMPNGNMGLPPGAKINKVEEIPGGKSASRKGLGGSTRTTTVTGSAAGGRSARQMPGSAADSSARLLLSPEATYDSGKSKPLPNSIPSGRLSSSRSTGRKDKPQTVTLAPEVRLPASNSRYSPPNRQDPRSALRVPQPASNPGFIGPVGYDVK